MSSIPEWYSGKNIFVTGSTGFMGKILVEKLLRSCSNLDGIYLLIRSKRNKTPAQRQEDFVNAPIFDLIRDQPNGPILIEKIHIVAGDVSKDGLNLSPEDLSTLQAKIDIVFHMAANVRFDQPLKEALAMNTGGTNNVLEVVKTFKKLLGFVHVSTCYCHCEETVLEEKMYPAPHDPRKMLKMINWLDNEMVETLTPKLLLNAPNTYAYTKCLTEQLVGEAAEEMPIAIVRPSIVTAAWREPIAGWVDNLNGPTGLMVGAGKGVIRTMHCNPDLIAEIVPVDVAINALIIVGKELGMSHKSKEPMVVNISSGQDNPITWGEALETGKKHFYENPFSLCLWYPGGSIKSNYYYHMFCVALFHYAPAYFVDFFMYLFKQPQFLVKAQERVSTGLKVLQYYTTRPWVFHNEKIKELYSNLSEEDKDTFFTDISRIDSNKYLFNYIMGARKYCMREEPETLPRARKNLKRLYYLDIVAKTLFFLLFIWMTYNIFSSILTFSESIRTNWVKY